MEFIGEWVGYVEVNCVGFAIAEASASVSSALGSAGQRVFTHPEGYDPAGGASGSAGTLDRTCGDPGEPLPKTVDNYLGQRRR